MYNVAVPACPPLIQLSKTLVLLLALICTGWHSSADAACETLTKELLGRYAKSGIIIVGISDWSIYEIFGYSWVRNWDGIGVTNFIYGAADSKTSETLQKLKVPCFDASKGVQEKNNYKWGSSSWTTMTWQKVALVQQILDHGYNVIFSDLDVAWWRDPLPYYEKNMVDFDMLVSSDGMQTGNPKGDDGPEVLGGPQWNINTGVYMLKSSPGGKALIKGWLDVRAHHGGSDQTGYYEMMRSGHGFVQNAGFTVLKGAARMGLLPVSAFMHSYTHFIERLHTVHGVDPYEMHMVWGFGALPGKQHRMREAMMYHDPPEYYDPAALMTVQLTYPELPADYNSWQENEAMIQFHLQAMEMQLKQLRHAMAVAISLQRVLVIPRLRCYCIKNWFGSEQCRIPGDKVTVFPFNCSLGQAVRPKKIYAGINVGGYTLQFREHTFLENPRTPASVRDNYTWVLPSEQLQCKKCIKEGMHHDQHQQLQLAGGDTEAGLVDALRGYKVTKRLHFVSIEKLMSRFADDDKQQQFEKEMGELAQKWCCRGPQEVVKQNKTDSEIMPLIA